jgi:hypothetical protein
MSPIIEQLQEMRPRIAMYVGSNSLPKLAAFLRGYEHAVVKFGIAPHENFLTGFQDWISRRFSVSISKSWEEIISFYSANDREAMERFWESLDEYLTENKDTLGVSSERPSATSDSSGATTQNP